MKFISVVFISLLCFGLSAHSIAMDRPLMFPIGFCLLAVTYVALTVAEGDRA